MAELADDGSGSLYYPGENGDGGQYQGYVPPIDYGTGDNLSNDPGLGGYYTPSVPAPPPPSAPPPAPPVYYDANQNPAAVLGGQDPLQPPANYISPDLQALIDQANQALLGSPQDTQGGAMPSGYASGGGIAAQDTLNRQANPYAPAEQTTPVGPQFLQWLGNQASNLFGSWGGDRQSLMPGSAIADAPNMGNPWDVAIGRSSNGYDHNPYVLAQNSGLGDQPVNDSGWDNLNPGMSYPNAANWYDFYTGGMSGAPIPAPPDYFGGKSERNQDLTDLYGYRDQLSGDLQQINQALQNGSINPQQADQMRKDATSQFLGTSDSLWQDIAHTPGGDPGARGRLEDMNNSASIAKLFGIPGQYSGIGGNSAGSANQGNDQYQSMLDALNRLNGAGGSGGSGTGTGARRTGSGTGSSSAPGAGMSQYEQALIDNEKQKLLDGLKTQQQNASDSWLKSVLDYAKTNPYGARLLSQGYMPLWGGNQLQRATAGQSLMDYWKNNPDQAPQAFGGQGPAPYVPAYMQGGNYTVNTPALPAAPSVAVPEIQSFARSPYMQTNNANPAAVTPLGAPVIPNGDVANNPYAPPVPVGQLSNQQYQNNAHGGAAAPLFDFSNLPSNAVTPDQNIHGLLTNNLQMGIPSAQWMRQSTPDAQLGAKDWNQSIQGGNWMNDIEEHMKREADRNDIGTPETFQ